ncbi:MAG: ATP-dependent 6-phosphofructokinase [Chthoniobacteraceae bacterium]|jgi:ATP-dependent phosphofructokinase / diphosphate-dependent phosphofructokinase
MERRRIGILNSGGDCPGLNAVLRGATRAALKLGWEVVGFKDGFEGMLPPGRFIMLDRHKTAGIMPLGGTILGTTNKGHFVAKVGMHGDKAVVPEEIIEQARAILKGLRVEGLIVIGGDGSLSTALQLHEAGIPTVGVPKTIDNDLAATAMTFGFDSAVACVADALDRLHTTASSHRRVMVIEVMGRHAGWIALYGGLAGGADIILLPEIPFDYQKVVDAVNKRTGEGCLSTMIVVAEGARPKDGPIRATATASGEYRMGGIAEEVAAEVAAKTDREVRVCVLGHLQRGGAPTTLDRILGTRFGIHAVEMIAAGKYGHMVSYQNYLVTDVPIADAVNRLRLVSPDGQMVKTARAVEVEFGD